MLWQQRKNIIVIRRPEWNLSYNLFNGQYVPCGEEMVCLHISCDWNSMKIFKMRTRKIAVWFNIIQ